MGAVGLFPWLSHTTASALLSFWHLRRSILKVAAKWFSNNLKIDSIHTGEFPLTYCECLIPFCWKSWLSLRPVEGNCTYCPALMEARLWHRTRRSLEIQSYDQTFSGKGCHTSVLLFSNLPGNVTANKEGCIFSVVLKVPQTGTPWWKASLISVASKGRGMKQDEQPGGK